MGTSLTWGFNLSHGFLLLDFTKHMGTWAPENWDSTMLNPSGDGRNFEATLQ
jgi:hypothetical protein